MAMGAARWMDSRCESMRSQREHSYPGAPELPGAAVLPLFSTRLTLRRFAESDADLFCAYRNDPEIARYQGWTGCSPDQAAEFVRHHASQPFGVPGEWLQIAIALKATNVLIGDCALRIHATEVR